MKTYKFVALFLALLLLLPCVTALGEVSLQLNDENGRIYLNAIAKALHLKENADPSFICGELKALKASAATLKVKMPTATKKTLDEAIRITGGFTESQSENLAFWNKELVSLNKQFAKSAAAKREKLETAVAGDPVTVSGTITNDATGAVLSAQEITALGSGELPSGYTLNPSYEGTMGSHTVTISRTASFYSELFAPLSKLHDATKNAAIGNGVLDGATRQDPKMRPVIIVP